MQQVDSRLINKDVNPFPMYFLIAGASTVLVIRFYLASTGYPQIGGGGLHISHMLWGGLLMLLALGLAFPGRRVKAWMALLGGAGFGLFIDELGKFITSDNNYFFRPTLALIYIIFVLLLLLFMLLERRRHSVASSPLADALEILAEGGAEGLYEQDKQKMLWLLGQPASKAPFESQLAGAVQSLPTLPDRPSSPFASMLKRFTASPYFLTVLAVFFACYTFLRIFFGLSHLLVPTDLIKVAWIAACLLSASMLAIGLLLFSRDRFAACLWFKRGILAAIGLTTCFVFFIPPLSVAALAELLVNIAILFCIDSLMYSYRAPLRDQEELYSPLQAG